MPPPSRNVQNFAQNLGGRPPPPLQKCGKIHKEGPFQLFWHILRVGGGLNNVKNLFQKVGVVVKMVVYIVAEGQLTAVSVGIGILLDSLNSLLNL